MPETLHCSKQDPQIIVTKSHPVCFENGIYTLAEGTEGKPGDNIIVRYLCDKINCPYYRISVN